MGLLDKLFGKNKKEAPAPVPQPAQDAGKHSSENQEDWAHQSTPQELQAHEVREMIAGPNPPILLDVREQHERVASGYIPNSIHMPMGEVPSRMHELAKDQFVVVYCASGMRSFDVGFLLIENGFKNVANLNGGIRSWDGEVARD